MKTHPGSRFLRIALCLLGAHPAVTAFGAADEAIKTLVGKEKPAVLETLRELVAFESGS
jgi:hypothetical protein